MADWAKVKAIPAGRASFDNNSRGFKDIGGCFVLLGDGCSGKKRDSGDVLRGVRVFCGARVFDILVEERLRKIVVFFCFCCCLLLFVVVCCLLFVLYRSNLFLSLFWYKLLS